MLYARFSGYGSVNRQSGVCIDDPVYNQLTNILSKMVRLMCMPMPTSPLVSKAFEIQTIYGSSKMSGRNEKKKQKL